MNEQSFRSLSFGACLVQTKKSEVRRQTLRVFGLKNHHGLLHYSLNSGVIALNHDVIIWTCKTPLDINLSTRSTASRWAIKQILFPSAPRRTGNTSVDHNAEILTVQCCFFFFLKLKIVCFIFGIWIFLTEEYYAMWKEEYNYLPSPLPTHFESLRFSGCLPISHFPYGTTKATTFIPAQPTLPMKIILLSFPEPEPLHSKK